MRLPIALLSVWAAGVLAAQTATTETLDLPAGGILRFHKSIGELTVEGWDQPRVEISVIRSEKPGREERDASRGLERVGVHAERRGDEIAVDTVFLKPFPLVRPFRGGLRSAIELECRVKAPRNARLEIEHQSGEVHLESMAGDIRVTDGKGQITLYLPEQGQYSIDARAGLGAVDSDFPGRAGRRLAWGHSLVQPGPEAPHKIYLRVGFGDITILKAPRPEAPPPAAEK